MTHIHPERPKDVICLCSGTTAGQIRKLIDKGVDDLEGLSRATGACSGCGACDTDILGLLAGQAPPASVDAVNSSPADQPAPAGKTAENDLKEHDGQPV